MHTAFAFVAAGGHGPISSALSEGFKIFQASAWHTMGNMMKYEHTDILQTMDLANLSMIQGRLTYENISVHSSQFRLCGCVPFLFSRR